MNKTNQRAYLAPEIEVIEMAVEQGFNGSLGGENSNSDVPMLQSIDAEEKTIIGW